MQTSGTSVPLAVIALHGSDQTFDQFEMDCQIGDPETHMHGDLVVGTTVAPSGWTITADLKNVEGTVSAAFMVQRVTDTFLEALGDLPDGFMDVVEFGTSAVISPIVEASLHLGNLRISSTATATSVDLTMSGEISIDGLGESFTVEDPGQIMMAVLSSVGADHYPTIFAELGLSSSLAMTGNHKIGFGT